MKALYGTRDAAQNWEYEYSAFMIGVGFSRGRSSPCVFRHASRDLRVVVHGDDFTVLGKEASLNWFQAAIKGRFG